VWTWCRSTCFLPLAFSHNLHWNTKCFNAHTS
jgi:hypothetical protein